MKSAAANPAIKIKHLLVQLASQPSDNKITEFLNDFKVQCV